MIQIECKINENGEEVTGYLVIDSTIDNSSAGGVRMSMDITIEELSLLARNMTLKYGFLGIPQGGAKGGIIYDPEASPEKRRLALSLFGKGVAPFLKNRMFIPGSDIGTDSDDIQWMIEASGRGKSKRTLPSGRSSYYTGLTVFVSAERAAKHLGIEMKGATVAIEGFGRVGSEAARFFAEKGAKVVAVSTSKGAIYNENGLDVSCLIGELAAKGSTFVSDYKEADRIPKAQLLTLDVDILSPCAKYHSINGTNMYEIKSKIISAGANVPVDNDAIEILHSRPILYLPDFVTNCGGVLGTYIEIAGLPLNRVSSLIPGLIGSKIDEIILNAKERGIPPITYAKEIAMERFHHLKGSAEGKGLFGIALRPSIIRAVRNFIPPFILGKMAKIYIQRYLDRQL
ncbi:MAG: Glu/Leu/Phe/Val dehydrogenase dimerization domain-containing protein [Nitrospirota bacterium]